MDGVVGQMDERITDVIEGVLSATRADVPILVAISLQRPIDAREEPEATEVKFAFVHKKWIVDVLLDYESPITFFARWSPNDLLHFTECFYYSYANSAISVLTRLDDPRVLRRSKLALDLFDSVFVVRIRLTPFILVIVCGTFPFR